MHKESASKRLLQLASGLGLVLLLLLAAPAAGAEGSERAPAGIEAPQWRVSLPTDTCYNQTHGDCQFSSPVVADLVGDEKLEIVVATNRGHVLAFDEQGTLLWDRDIAPAFGMAPNTHEIASSPAVADVDADGRPEIIVGAGTLRVEVCTQGGVIVLEHDGQVKQNWPVLSDDWGVDPVGCADTVFSTPTAGDLDGDGDLEVISAGFDKRINAWQHDATPVPGFPPDSHLRTYHPDWQDLLGRLGDTIWSSPAVGLLDGDNELDIVIGSDEGMFEEAGDWVCPHEPPPGVPSNYCGGSLYAISQDATFLSANFPTYIHETIQSTPAIVDANGDGRNELFVGTGSFYYRNSPDHPTDGFRVFGFDSQGNPLPGWEGGQQVEGSVPASPAVGDITGDGRAEIVVATSTPEKRLYAWQWDGSLVKGFPMMPRDHTGNTFATYDVGTGFVLADYDGDGAMEIFFTQAWGVTIVDGDGSQLTSAASDDSRPAYVTNGTLINTPAVSDIDQDGRLEMVVFNSELLLWELPDSGPDAAWPMFKQNARRSSSDLEPALQVTPGEAVTMVEKGEEVAVTLRLAVTNAEGFSYRIEGPEQSYFDLPIEGNSPGGETTVTLRAPASTLSLGEQAPVTLSISAVADGRTAVGSPATVRVRVTVVEDLYEIALPMVTR